LIHPGKDAMFFPHSNYSDMGHEGWCKVALMVPSSAVLSAPSAGIQRLMFRIGSYSSRDIFKGICVTMGLLLEYIWFMRYVMDTENYSTAHPGLYWAYADKNLYSGHSTSIWILAVCSIVITCCCQAAIIIWSLRKALP
jgi:hypothetical protein